MLLKVRYEEDELVIEVPMNSDLYVTVGLEPDENADMQSEENRIQEAFNKLFNRPDYNNWHSYHRHIGYTKAKEDEEGYPVDDSEPLMEEVMDDRIFRKDEIDRERQEEFEEVCEKIRTIFKNKPHWAEAFIAIRLKGVRVKDYASSVGIKNPTIISLFLMRAEKKLKEYFEKRKI